MQIGMIGLGRMGANMVRRLMRAGHDCVVYDVSPDAVWELAGEGSAGASSLAASVQTLQPPRCIFVMVPAAFVDDTIAKLAPLLQADDTIIDGGNSYYRDDLRRAAELGEQGLHYVDMGTSGGVFGLERGYCLMIGGDDKAVERLDPFFSALAPGVDAAGRPRGRPPRGGGGSDPRRAGLPALRPGRRGALREDGAQRDRVRDDGRVRGGAEHPRARQHRRRAAGARRRDDAAARSRGLHVRPADRRDRRGLAARQGGALGVAQLTPTGARPHPKNA